MMKAPAFIRKRKGLNEKDGDGYCKCLHWTKQTKRVQMLENEDKLCECLYDGLEKCFSINFPSFEPFY
ncbi:CLUMA_CG018430, isoform A [Clunio marinus]|uniref:CLUMA_CG018430, isoform A n=1 Tax=Clunio marinus TaxID=568069 RepID=A0A1J1J106_9DIPT|nr:CLUMA_CG018430, isoform A [Clunio marinus]